MTSAPFLFLDVDGVLNAVCGGEPDLNTWPDYQTGSARAGNSTWRITWSPSVIKALEELNDSGAVNLQWLTTWGREANDSLLQLLQFTRGFPVAGEAPPFNNGGEWWKLRVVQDFYEEFERPFVWLDDDLKGSRQANLWLETLPEGSHLAISPRTYYGLTPEHISIVREWVANRG